MLLIFWDIKEEPEIKKTIAKKLEGIKVDIEKVVGKNPTAKIVFVDSSKIRSLNKIYRKLDKETDVLSFAELDMEDNLPALKESESLGEIYINYNWVIIDKNPTNLLLKLFIHGYLHLLGYDHEKDQGEMEKLENKLKKYIQ